MDKNLPNGYVSSRTKRSILLWCVFVLGLTFVPRFYASFFQEKSSFVPLEDKEKNEQLGEKIQKTREKKKQVFNAKYKRPSSKFDPNLYSVEDWQKLGLSVKQAEIVIKFSKRGLRSNEDLGKIYVFPKELLTLIADSTIYPIPETKNATTSKSNFDQKIVNQLVDINNATIEQLVELKGIGEYLAARIVERREVLGGFYSVNQLKEIKYIDDPKLELLRKEVVCKDNLLRKIKLNTVTLEELKKHPYVSYSVANSIVKLRDQKNGFQNIEEIMQSVLISEELFQKLKPYLSL